MQSCVQRKGLLNQLLSRVMANKSRHRVNASYFSYGTNGSIGSNVTPTAPQMLTSKTSKYHKILLALREQKMLNESQKTTMLKNESRANGAKRSGTSQKAIALTVPLVLLGVFLAFVVFCHRFDTIRTRKIHKKRRVKAIKGIKNSETEQAVEEVGQDVNLMLLGELQREAMHKMNQKQIGKVNYAMCEEIGQHIGRCMCRLERCAHCLGYEAKKLQWKDLVYNDAVNTNRNTFDCKNASTQTWLPVHCQMKNVPQSSHRDGSLSRRNPSFRRQFVVGADSVFGSEVSSKPHFPSSASNYTDSKTSDPLSSVREVSGSFYYSATSAQNTSEFHEICSTGPSEKRSRQRITKQRGLKKQYVSEAQLLSGDEDWI